MTGFRIAPDLFSMSENVMFGRTLANRPLRGLTSNVDSTSRQDPRQRIRLELQDESVNVLRVLSVNPLH